MQNTWVETPLPIAYFEEDSAQIVVLPGIDLNLRTQIIGVQVQDIIFGTKNDNLGIPVKEGWLGIRWWMQTLNLRYFAKEWPAKPYFRVPKISEQKKAVSVTGTFNATMKILRENGVDADDWENLPYVVTEEDNGRYSLVVNPYSGEEKAYSADDELYHVRAVVDGNKPLIQA